MGNLFNSEIVGIPTDLPWSFIFTSVDGYPRHPAQLYEALAYLLIFFVLFNYYRIKNGKTKDGFIFGLFLVTVFSFRFLVEFLKENQTYFEKDLFLNMGQLLSIPLIVGGIVLIIKSKKFILTQKK